MCLNCLETTEDCVIAKHRSAIGMRCGKSKDFINGILKQGCPRGKKKCRMCSKTGKNDGRSSNKGKGKNKNYRNIYSRD